MNEKILNFVFPKINRVFIIRLSVSVILLVVVFSRYLMPCVINGKSMVPTYKAIGFNFCTKYKYRNNPIEIGDVVVIKYVGKKYYLKRVVALEGDTVEFRNGVLYVNGIAQEELYRQGESSDWNLEPRTVEPNHVYVVGDNRSMNLNEHSFGQVLKSRVIGGVLW